MQARSWFLVFVEVEGGEADGVVGVGDGGDFDVFAWETRMGRNAGVGGD